MYIQDILLSGQSAVQYLFLQWKWHITLEQYASMNTISTIIQGELVSEMLTSLLYRIHVGGDKDLKEYRGKCWKSIEMRVRNAR